MWPFRTGKEVRRNKIESDLRTKVAASQLALQEAAITTATVAQNVSLQMRRAMEESIRQFETTACLMSDALIISDAKGLIQAFNPAAEAMFGTTFAEINRTQIEHLFLVEGCLPSRDTLWDSIEETRHSVVTDKLHGRRCNGEIFLLDASMTRLERHDGSTAMMILVRDLSETLKERRHAALHEKRFQSLFDLTFDGVLIVVDSKIVAANKSSCLLFGLEPEVMLGAESHTLITDIEMHTVASSIRTTRGAGGRMQLLFSSTEICWNGAVAYLITVKEVTQANVMGSGLKTDGRDMICVFGPDFRISFANYFFRAYYGCMEAIGEDVRAMFPPSDRETFSLKLKTLSPENPIVFSQVHHIPDGEKMRLLNWLDCASFDADGQVVEYQRTGRDLTLYMDEMQAADDSKK